MIIGGSGCLGKALTQILTSGTSKWKVHVIDFNPNDEVDKSIVLNKNQKLFSENQTKAIYNEIAMINYESILNVVGALEGGSINNGYL